MKCKIIVIGGAGWVQVSFSLRCSHWVSLTRKYLIKDFMEVIRVQVYGGSGFHPEAKASEISTMKVCMWGVAQVARKQM